ncbi:SDR family oxidoreductase [Thermosulfurimonas marina]|uniref:SDR family oxidoreductase n=1 Tax=Thermosulfurimonas marina TaxID=2047767 RepID=A0A6H1WRV5_9BACT|nr:SDR family oxidoreductase [Thermosulfurimonas marina]QJA05889.1 SDR family oxidoreductase [Thermosulfurimonas marina]
MRVLVTGAGGYIGSVLVPMLLEKGYNVLALDRFFFGRDRLPPESENLRILEEDIRFFEKEILKDVYAVIDLAALSNDPSGELDPVKTWSINYLGRFRVATLAKLMGVKRYILPSSCSVYGFQDEVVDETSPTNPLTTYAKANLKAERDILNLADDKFTVVILRQATVYGLSPRMRFDLAINGMVRGFFKNGRIPILRDGTQWRPFVHVKDTSRAMLLALESPKEKVNREVFNVGSDEQNYQIFDLAKRVAQAIGIPFEYEWYGLPDHRSYRVSFKKIREVLGFKPDYNAERGAVEIWEALKSGSLDPDDPTTITVEWYKKLIQKGVMV